MKKLIGHKAFIGAFLTTYGLFFVLTMYVFEFKYDSLGVSNYEYGFPFAYYHESCYGGSYLWGGLFDNILSAAVLSGAVGLLFAHLWLKFSATEFRAKWHI